MTLKAMRLENFFVVDLAEREHRLGLREQFVHRLLAGARHRLIGRHHHALDRGLVVQRLERDHELRGRAIRIGDDVLLGEADDRVGVHFRHDQRHVRVHAPGRRIVDHHRALRARSWATIPSTRRRPPTSGRCRRRRNRNGRAPSPSASCRRTSTPGRCSCARRAPPPRRRETPARPEWRAFRARHCRWHPPRRPCNPLLTLRNKFPRAPGPGTTGWQRF